VSWSNQREEDKSNEEEEDEGEKQHWVVGLGNWNDKYGGKESGIERGNNQRSCEACRRAASSPESENEETGDNEEVEANADEDEEPEDDPELVRDCQKENGD